MKFKASCVTWQNQDGVVMLGFADKEFETKQYLLLQRTLIPNKRECALGMDRIYVELNSQIKSAYGRIDEALLRNDGVVLRLDPSTAAKISDGEDIEIMLDAPNVNFRDLPDQFRLLLGQDKVQVVCTE